MAQTAYTNEYKAFLRACEVLGCNEYDVTSPVGAACWDAAYITIPDANDPAIFVRYHCIVAASCCAKDGFPCTPYEYAVNMALACSAIGKYEESALFHHYADTVRPAPEVMRL